MPERPRAFPWRLAAIAAVGVALRAIYLFVIARHTTGLGDWHFYQWQANLIADGRGFIDPYQLLAGAGSQPSAGHPPLYPLVLAGVSKLGGNGELAHRSAGLVFGACSIALIGLLGRRVAGERAGLIAAGIAAVYPIFIAADGALMSEGLYTVLVAGTLLVAYALLDRPGGWLALALGALIGLAALTRSEALLLLPLLAWPIAWRAAAGTRLRLAAIAAVGVVVVLAPWTIRNWSVFDRPVLISTNDATVLAGANCPLTFHGIDTGGWNIACISPRRPGLNEAEQASIWRREGLDYARDHERRLPAVVAVRVLRSWDLYQPRRQVMFAEGRQRRVEQAGIAVYYVLALLAIAGAVMLRRRRETLLVLLAPAVVVVITSVVGYGVTRFRHVFEPCIVVLAAVAAERILRRRREAAVVHAG